MNATSTSRPTPVPAVDPDADLSADDPRLVFAMAVRLAGSVIAATDPEQAAQPTPCDELSVGQLVGHMVAVLRRLSVVGGGGDPFSVPTFLELPAPTWMDAWTDAAHELQAAWSDPGILATMVRLPFAVLPGAAAMAIYTSEISVHTWDLARATGQEPEWDDEVIGGALATMRHALPADGRGPEVPFGPTVVVADDAPLIDQLVAWNGRRP